MNTVAHGEAVAVHKQSPRTDVVRRAIHSKYVFSNLEFHRFVELCARELLHAGAFHGWCLLSAEGCRIYVDPTVTLLLNSGRSPTKIQGDCVDQYALQGA